MQIDVELSESGIEKLIKQLEDYKKSIREKNKLFLEKLAERGIEVAEAETAKGTHKMPGFISFRKEVETEDGVVTVYVIGEGQPFQSDWVDAFDEEHHDMVYPLSMLEFGSAGLALERQTAFGVEGGRGSFTHMGHDNDIEWYVKRGDKKNNKVRHATAIAPTRPMYHAAEKMRSEILDVMKEVFTDA